MATITIRPGTPTDLALVCDSFLRTWGRSCYGEGVPARVLLAKMEALLDSPSWRLSIACVDSEPDEILGFAVWRPPTFPSTPHERPVAFAMGWLQVKEIYRRQGVGRALLSHVEPPKEFGCAFLPPDVARLGQFHGMTLRFRPYLPDVAGGGT